MLISLHLPKTAGTSFADELRANFGGDLWLDYADMPMQVPRPQREWSAIRQGWRLRHSLPQTVRCVHGHFLAIKYALACSRRNASFVTWLRDAHDVALYNWALGERVRRTTRSLRDQ